MRPYVKRIARCADEGADTIFLVGRGNKKSIPSIAKYVVGLGIARSQEVRTYHMSYRGTAMLSCVARLEIDSATSSDALSHILNDDEWKDFEPIVEGPQSA